MKTPVILVRLSLESNGRAAVVNFMPSIHWSDKKSPSILRWSGFAEQSKDETYTVCPEGCRYCICLVKSQVLTAWNHPSTACTSQNS